MASVGEAVIRIGANTTDLNKEIKNSTNKLMAFGKHFNTIFNGLFAGGAVYSAVKGFNEINMQFDKTSKIIGGNVNQINALSRAFNYFEVDTNETLQTLQGFNYALGEAKRGGGALVEVARKYGIAFANSNGAMMNAEQYLTNLSSQLGRFDKQTRAVIASQLGLSENMQYALIEGGDALKSLISEQKKLNLITEKDLKITKAFKLEMFKFKDQTDQIKRLLGRFLLPLLTKLLKTMTELMEYLRKHKGFVLALLGTILFLLGKMAVVAALAFAPFIAFVAVLVTIAAIFEDIYNYLKGGDSLIGEWAKKIPYIAEVMEVLRKPFEAIFDFIKSIINFFENPSVENFFKIFENGFKALNEWVELIYQGVEALVSALINAWKPLEKIQEIAGGAFDKVKGFFGFGGNEMPMLSPANNYNYGGNTTNNYNITANAHGVSNNNALALGRSLGSQINTQTRQHGGFGAW